MAYRYDPDLEFFKDLSAKELDGLFRLLTFGTDWVECITSCENYKIHTPDHSYYWQGIAEGIQLCGTNPAIHGGEFDKGKLYKDILCNVCDELKINYAPNVSTILIERSLLINFLQMLLSEMSPSAISNFCFRADLSEEQKQHLESSKNILPVLSEIFDDNNLIICQMLLNELSDFLFCEETELIPLLAKAMILVMKKVTYKFNNTFSKCHITLPIVIHVAILRKIQECYASIKSKPEKVSSVLESLLRTPATISKIDFKRINSFIQCAESWNHKDQEKLMSIVLNCTSGTLAWDYFEYDGPEAIFTLATSSELRDIYRQASRLYPESSKAGELNYVLTLAEQKALRLENPIYNLNQQPSVAFKDFGFKLAVINELMYCQDKLKPRLYQNLFLDEYPKYAINHYSKNVYDSVFGHISMRRSTMYDLILNEIKDYLYSLDIPCVLLSKVTTIKLKKNTELYMELIHPGARNATLSNNKSNLININKDTIDDLELLPNLECIYISESATVPETFIEIVKARNISLIIENEDGVMVETIYQRNTELNG